MRIVVAPDKFKGSVTAREAAEELAHGMSGVCPEADLTILPVADGGEGTLEAALEAGFERRDLSVTGPVGEPVAAAWAQRGNEAVVEMSLASGIAVLPQNDDGDPILAAREATSRGTGELIAAALDAGCTSVVVAVGGSACTDGGAGMLAGLGARLLDESGEPLPDGGAALSDLDRVDLASLHPRIGEADFVLAADVDHPLLGDNGAAAVFGPQKGASQNDVADLDAALGTFRDKLAETLGDSAHDAAKAPGAGAAGGVGFVALTVLAATRRPGIDVVLDLVALDDAVTGADLLITGEGSLDEQSLGGKTPMGVLAVGQAHNVPVIAVCGRTTLDDQTLRKTGFEATYALADLAPDSRTSMREAPRLLRTIGGAIGQKYCGAVDYPPARGEAKSRAERLALVERAEQIAVANRANDPERIRELIRDYSAEQGISPTDGGDDVPTCSGTPRRDRYDLVVRGRQVSCGDHFAAREVAVRDGKIVAIEPLGAQLEGDRVVELAEDETLIPGLVDTHVHVNEPGRTEWEGFESATRAAAAGGVTTIVDMPLNSVPATVNEPALTYKRLFARDHVFVDVGFWGGSVPGNVDDLRPLHDDGVFGFKCFLLHSGVDEFPHLEADEMEEAMVKTKTFDSLMIVHAEDSRTIDKAPSPTGDVYDRFLQSRPRGAENIAIAEVIERTRWTGARSHILHVSSSDSLPMIATAKRDGLDITVETCPHYLTLLSEEIPNGATAFKCCPPVREVDNREKLWEGLMNGTIDFIVSDHSPSTLALKDLGNGDFGVAWGGVSSLQLGLSLIWTEARRRGIPLAKVLDWMARRPAERVGLRSKGRLSLGYDADFSVFAANEGFVVDAANLHHKNPITPYQGKVLSGKVRKTFVGGQLVDYQRPTGRLLRRGTA